MTRSGARDSERSRARTNRCTDRVDLGRYDRANRLRIAQTACARFGWSLHVIENCADDPPRDQPDAFLKALDAALASGAVPQPVAPEKGARYA
jgi:hypothetical protein